MNTSPTASLTDSRTIAAISTPPGTGGIATIRISGPQAFEIVSSLWKGKDLTGVPSHTLHLGTLLDEDGEPLDQGVAALFRAPRSYTGEDTVELSLHGSPWIQRRALEALVVAGASPAGPGEFTQRAFLNGRLDLAQAEGVADLIAADSRAAARVALSQASGSFSSRLDSLRQRLIQLASLLELELDFSEEDVEFADRAELRNQAQELRDEIARMAESYRKGRIYKEGLPVVLAGVPNAGKSSLLNALLEEEKALVSNVPGTTRDIIEDTLEIDGLLMRFYDTAGLRPTSDQVERLGIERAEERIRRAAVILWLLDPTQPLAPQLEQLRSTDLGEARLIPLLTKCDLTPIEASQLTDNELAALRISSRTGEGLSELRGRLRSIPEAGQRATETPVSNLRHYQELRDALPYLDRLLEGLTTHLPADLLAMELRGALHHLSAILGAITNDALLANIFSRFCIGK